MDFEWDEAKRASNIAKHGLDFADTVSAFNDRFGIEEIEHIDGEDRWRLIAAIPRGIIFVIYTERDESLRIISARQATKNEREKYYEGKGH